MSASSSLGNSNKSLGKKTKDAEVNTGLVYFPLGLLYLSTHQCMTLLKTNYQTCKKPIQLSFFCKYFLSKYETKATAFWKINIREKMYEQEMYPNEIKNPTEIITVTSSNFICRLLIKFLKEHKFNQSLNMKKPIWSNISRTSRRAWCWK